MKVENMTSERSGKPVANQFIIRDPEAETIVFQSYGSVIVKQIGRSVYLDERFWDYSVTTSKYRNQFLGETKKETQAKIDSGEYELVNLN